MVYCISVNVLKYYCYCAGQRQHSNEGRIMCRFKNGNQKI